MEHEIVTKYLGCRFKHLGRDPKEGLDCYGLILCVYKDFQLDLVDVINYEADFALHGKDYFIEHYHEQWFEVPVPHVFDVVLYKTKEGIANHAGLVIKGNRCLQATKAGVVITRLNDPIWFHRQEGFYRFKEKLK